MILTHYFPSDLLQISNLDELSKSITKYSPEKQKKLQNNFLIIQDVHCGDLILINLKII